MNKFKVTDTRRWPQDPPDYYFEIKYIGESFAFIRYVNGTESMHSNRSISDETVPYQKERAEYKDIFNSILRKNHVKGYPTKKEWDDIIMDIKRYMNSIRPEV